MEELAIRKPFCKGRTWSDSLDLLWGGGPSVREMSDLYQVSSFLMSHGVGCP